MENSKQIQRFLASGDADDVARRIAVAYVLASVFISYIDEADDICRRHGLVYRELKFRANNLQGAFNAYHQVMLSMIGGDGEAGRRLCYDFDELKGIIDKFMQSNQLCEDEK